MALAASLRESAGPDSSASVFVTSGASVLALGVEVSRRSGLSEQLWPFFGHFSQLDAVSFLRCVLVCLKESVRLEEEPHSSR